MMSLNENHTLKRELVATRHDIAEAIMIECLVFASKQNKWTRWISWSKQSLALCLDVEWNEKDSYELSWRILIEYQLDIYPTNYRAHCKIPIDDISPSRDTSKHLSYADELIRQILDIAE